MTQPKQKISKLYYGKWPYKIECYLPKVSYIARYGAEATRLWAANTNDTDQHWHDRLQQTTQAGKNAVVKFLDKVEPFLELDIKVRAEHSHFNIFCRDPALRDRIAAHMAKWVVAVHGPASEEELAFMLAGNNKKVVCNNLPHKKYQYKVMLNTAMTMENRYKFLTWVATYQDRVRITGESKYWFGGLRRWSYTPFMYVEDEKTLTMMTLFLGSNIKKVEEYVLRSSINTSLEQE